MNDKICEHDLILLAGAISGEHYYSSPIFKCIKCLKIFKLDEMYSSCLQEISIITIDEMQKENEKRKKKGFLSKLKEG